MATIRVSEETYSALRGHLERAYPEEEGAFAILAEVPGDGSHRAFALREIVLPKSGDWARKGRDTLAPTTGYINRAVVTADSQGSGLAFVHSHPHPGHPAGLSAVDEQSTRKLFRNVRSILGVAPLASLVITPESFAGVVAQDGRLNPVRSIRLLGGRISEVPAADVRVKMTSPPPIVDPIHARQVLAIDPANQNRIASARIAVVGAGGTGSCVLEEIVRLGAKKVWVVDDDELEASNVSRVYGSTPIDASKNSPKVDVVKRHLSRISPSVRIIPIRANVMDPSLVPLLSSMDVLFSCTDTHSSRSRLNDIAYQGYVPVIDTGCRILVRHGHVEGIFGRVRLLRPGLPCLWCTDTIDGTRILQESFSAEERERLAAEGYGSGLGSQPSVIHLTSMVASLGVNLFLQLFADFGPPHDGSEIFLNLAIPEIMRAAWKIRPGCRCQNVMALPKAE